MWGAEGVEREQQSCGVVCQNEKKNGPLEALDKMNAV